MAAVIISGNKYGCNSYHQWWSNIVFGSERLSFCVSFFGLQQTCQVFRESGNSILGPPENIHWLFYCTGCRIVEVEKWSKKWQTLTMQGTLFLDALKTATETERIVTSLESSEKMSFRALTQPIARLNWILKGDKGCQRDTLLASWFRPARKHPLIVLLHCVEL